MTNPLRPLGANLARAELRLGSGHAGLWYDKFFNQWNNAWQIENKLLWIETVTRNPLGDKPLLDEAAARLMRFSEAQGGKSGIFVAASRFVTGLGRSHPVENGFAWHPTLGMPYLPGSSIKGMVHAWAKNWAQPRLPDPQLDEIFGGPGQVGRVILLDALPIKPVQLAADIITPHCANWTQADPPGDWCSPTPIPFLVMERGNSFVFAITPAWAGAVEILEPAWQWLTDALQFLGGGAKTSVGYGRFELDQMATDAAVRQLREKDTARRSETDRQEKLKTPEGRWALELSGKSESDILELVRVHLENKPLTDLVERRAFAKAVENTGLPAIWAKRGKRDLRTQVGEKKCKERATLVRRVLA
ncbi:MAG: type III-B CRISPR module RAMP protein Cmr6 [Candidatus Binataceae bacterium]